MTASMTVSKFIEVVRRSDLVDSRRLDAYLAEQAKHSPNDDARQLARQMIVDGVLTVFQCRQLLQGKWRGFLLLHKYRVLAFLGAGGAGRVYLCRQAKLDRLVAIKILPAGQTQAAVDRFYREARAVAALNHPNIVRLFDVDHDQKFHFMVLEYVEGTNLQDLVDRNGKLDYIRAAHYISQAAKGLVHAHEAGWLHRDIKPGNILLDRQGVVKLLDLGLARALHGQTDNLTMIQGESSVIGTVDYLSPEQAMSNGQLDIRTDIYSLGVTCRFLLTGQTLFGDGSVTNKLLWLQVRSPQPLGDLRPDVPPEFVAVVDKMMARERDKRFSHPSEIIEALKPWTSESIALPSDVEIPRAPHMPGMPSGSGIVSGHDNNPSPSGMGGSSFDGSSLSSQLSQSGGSGRRSGSDSFNPSHQSLQPAASGGSDVNQASSVALAPPRARAAGDSMAPGAMMWRGSVIMEDEDAVPTGAPAPGFAALKYRLEQIYATTPKWLFWTMLGSAWVALMVMVVVGSIMLLSAGGAARNPIPKPNTTPTSSTSSVGFGPQNQTAVVSDLAHPTVVRLQ